MSRWTRNPQRFAIEQMNAAFNAAGHFSHFSRRDDLASLRLRLGEVDGVRLVAWLRDLDGDVDSLFVDDASGATIYLREWGCAEGAPCDAGHGVVDVTAWSHDALGEALALLERVGRAGEDG